MADAASFPYYSVPREARWGKVVAGRAPQDIDPHVNSRLHIGRTDKIASAGSCFAQRISEALQSSGYTYFVTEEGPPFLSAERKRELGYRVYSARYGNIYTVLQLLQLFRRAFGRFAPEEPVWQLADGKYVDPFRPSVQPGGFQSEEECLADRSSHLASVRRMFEEVDVFAFTLGLTESWISTIDGAVFPSCPGSALGGLHDPARHAFHNFSVSEVTGQLSSFVTELQAVNPKAQIILTVSPVPLLATYEPRHVLQARPDDIVMGSPPLAFTFGLGGMLLFPMWAGASVFFPDIPYTPQAMAQLMYVSGATICYTAPTFYRQMAPFIQALHAERGAPPPLRICVSAGEALPDATRQLWKQASGIEMLDGIGSTEMFHIFVSAAPADVRRGAIGKVVPGYVAKVVDDNGAEVPLGTVGKLAVQGPTGCRYMDDPRQTSYVKDGWNHPGDAFVQDADGYFFYQARTDDMIITAGYNVGAPEVEDALLRHPAVAECGVIGKPDAERGMIVKAFCVLKSGHAGDAAMVKALQDHVKASIAPYKYPREIDFVQTLPRTETGKLQRFRLKQP